jgi:type II secretory pathway component GspD/PulD (secretin)
VERSNIQQARSSQVVAAAVCLALLLCLSSALPANAQEAPTPDAAEPELQPSTPAVSPASFTRIFRVDQDSLLHLIAVPGLQLEDHQQAFRSFLTSRGVKLFDTSRLFYNHRTGVLTARGDPRELDAIETALADLAITPPQVTLRTLVVELSADALTPDLKKILALPDPQLSAADTNLIIRFATSVLTSDQARVVIRALEQRQGADMFSIPATTTLSGRQALVFLDQTNHDPITDPPFTAPDKPMKSQWSTKSPAR